MHENWWRELGDYWLDVSLSTRTPEITRADADWTAIAALWIFASPSRPLVLLRRIDIA
jgi:hypothetical protein